MSQAERRPLARRMARIAPFRVMEVLARAHALEAGGRSIVHMEVGEPDFPTAEPIAAAARAALDAGRTRYTPAAGIPALREAISRFYRDRHGVEVAPERILVTPGASGALQLALAVSVNAGEGVLLADPGYPCNRNLVRLVDGVPVEVAVGPDTGYQLDAALVARHLDERVAAVLVGTPANPTGTLVPEPELAAMIGLTRESGVQLIVDEIYHGLVYGADAVTALALADDVFVVNSFSKYFGMTGWRLGWLVAPRHAAREAEKLAQNLYISAPTLAQHAALAAFAPETIAILEARRREFAARRDFLLPALRGLGFQIPVAPAGAFYLYADSSAHAPDSQAFALAVLEEAGVAITPGLDFGRNAPERHVRFAYTTGLAALQEGVERLRRFLSG